MKKEIAYTADQNWAAKEFDINAGDVLWYHSGICYSRIGVRTQKAADKVTEKVKGQTVNGGMFHGMPLGGQLKLKDHIEVYC